MRVLIVNTAEKLGGAAIAARRLMLALQKQGVKASMLVRDKQTAHPAVYALPVASWRLKWNFLWERVVIWMNNGFRRQGIFGVDIANTGTDITALPGFKEADVIHLHWVNQGMLSLKDIRRIVQTGKPIVWTMHDMWACTGICHHAVDCTKYRTHCHDCEQLAYPRAEDLSYRVFRRKKELYSEGRFSFVACSRWLEELAKTSVLIGHHPITNIPNPIDTDTFAPQDKTAVRRKLGLPIDKRLLLFGSVKITDKRKGIDYLVEACKHIVMQKPELANEWGIVVLGQGTDAYQDSFPFPFYNMQYVSDETQLAEIYNAVDVYVTPSLQENLPNTIVEAMCCGVPCVGFRVGGIPQMIDHECNGYVAEFRSAEDLARGILRILCESDYAKLSIEARQKAEQTYAESHVARQYLRIYEQILSSHE